MKWFQHNEAKEIDEHDLPTEPLPDFDVASFAPTVANNGVSSAPEDATIPAPKPYEQPFPLQYVPHTPQTGSQTPSPYSPPASAYPYVPPAPTEQAPPRSRSTSTRSLVPALVGLCFVIVQFLLLIRFVITILGLLSNNLWGDIIYGLSGLFVLPFQALWHQVPSLQIPANIELYTLVAILVYGLVSRITVRFLKAMLNSR